MARDKAFHDGLVPTVLLRPANSTEYLPARGSQLRGDVSPGATLRPTGLVRHARGRWRSWSTHSDQTLPSLADRATPDLFKTCTGHWQATLMSPIADRFRQASQRFTDCTGELKSADWSAPTACTDWASADILKHVVETEADLLSRMPFAPAPALDVTDPLAAWPIVRATVQVALDDPSRADHSYDGYFGPTTFAETVDRFYTVDLLVHRWDLANSLGLTEHAILDADEINHIRASLERLGDNMRQPGLFGPEVAVPDDASQQTRVLAFVGRRG